MSYYSYGGGLGGFGAFPPVIKNLLIINVLVFLGQILAERQLMMWFALWPLANGFQIHQLVSYSFLHGGFGHIFFNMFALWMFGMQIENTWGSRRFLIYYGACVVGAGFVQLATTYFSGGMWPTVGASGGVFGILLAFGMLFPEQRIMLIFPPIPIKAKYFVIGYGVLELIYAGTGLQPGVAHLAHLGGMAAGFILIQYWRGQLPFKPNQASY
ncbi:MAG: rhomboid family intramembrane serine protease [Bacteroidetes bacterium]|nr:rhomboid family intramembrane serine protease [Bacteroidota bacterium]MCY4204809.1 rhomboid family intramembrane serine protease [Bacteroidota bacterium]